MTGLKVFTSATLSSSDVNSYLMRQTVIQCTSSTRPSSPHEGMAIHETDTNLTLQYTGSVWSPIAQTISSTFSLNHPSSSMTTNYAYWHYASGWTHVIGKATVASSSATGTEQWMFAYPGSGGPPVPNFYVDCAGAFTAYNQGAGAIYAGGVSVENLSPGYTKFRFHVSGYFGGLGASPSLSMAVGDSVAFSVQYPTVF